MTEPIANVQIYESVPLPTLMANRRCGLPTSDGFNALAPLFRLPEHLEHEITESKVRDFTTPKPFHAVKIQVLKERNIKLTDDLKGEFPMMVFALTLNLAMGSRIVLARTLAVVATSHLPRQLTIGTLYRFRRLLIELWRFVFCAVRTGQKGLVAIVEPCSVTRLGFRFKSFVVCQNGNIPITKCITFSSGTFDSALYLTRIPEPIPDECHTRIRR